MTGLEYSLEERKIKSKEESEKRLFKEAYLSSLTGLAPQYRIDKESNAEWLCNAAFDMALETVKLFSSYGDKL